MTWYFLVMVSVTVAAVLAGFCMGRLTGAKGVVTETGVDSSGSMGFQPVREEPDNRRMMVAGLWGQREKDSREKTKLHFAARQMLYPDSGRAEVQNGPDVQDRIRAWDEIEDDETDADWMEPDQTKTDQTKTDQGGTVRAFAPDRQQREKGEQSGRNRQQMRSMSRSVGINCRQPGNVTRGVGINRQQPGSVTRGVGTNRQQPGRRYSAPVPSGLHGIHGIRRGRNRQMAEEGTTWSVGSPVSGEVAAVYEGERPAVEILPVEDRICAPVGGKVVHLFPMGNAMLFGTDFGTELYIQIGNPEDELLGRYYRPRVVKNEIVGKGKVLLEFDRKGLLAAGVSPVVTVSVTNCAYGSDVRATASEWVGSGEEILKVQEIL